MSSSDVEMDGARPAARPAAEYGLPDDEVVAEIPVYLTQKLAKQLHLLQYPQKNAALQPGILRPREARIKPVHGQIELDIPLDVHGKQYNRERGVELGVGITDDGGLLDISTLCSVDIPKSSDYLAGLITNGELHLTAIDKVTQLRPSLKYLDRVAEKNARDSKLDDHDDEEDVDKKEAKAQSVQVRIRTAAEAEDALRQQQNSIAYMQQKLEEEPWSRLDFYDLGTDESATACAELAADNKEPLEDRMSPDEYLAAVIGSTAPDVM
ncbi:hypothetical protein GGF46_002955 [Coemansia sp. RSA 552]|nr:hypothetical protein GGF46_002955 [Coemansia sp. RSA 552]